MATFQPGWARVQQGLGQGPEVPRGTLKTAIRSSKIEKMTSEGLESELCFASIGKIFLMPDRPGKFFWPENTHKTKTKWPGFPTTHR